MTLLDPVLATAPLSVAMREGSQAAHTAAEDSPFMTELVSARINARGYRDYLRCFRDVYAQLEATGRELAGHPAVAAVLDPRLDRLPALERDLAYWTGVCASEGDHAPEGSPADSPATAAYVERLAATADWAPLFVAHHYTRYLGDLSGGQAIGRVLDRELGLGGAGVAFYSFPEIPKPKPFKDAYRSRLDALELSAAEKGRVVAEVNVAFALNQALFAELGERLDDYRR